MNNPIFAWRRRPRDAPFRLITTFKALPRPLLLPFVSQSLVLSPPTPSGCISTSSSLPLCFHYVSFSSSFFFIVLPSSPVSLSPSCQEEILAVPLSLPSSFFALCLLSAKETRQEERLLFCRSLSLSRQTPRTKIEFAWPPAAPMRPDSCRRG